MKNILTRQIGKTLLPDDILSADKKKCRRIGPCGLGDRAIYLNSFYIDRFYAVPYSDIRRVYKRVAVSSGGFTGKGVFATLPYFVVAYNGDQERQCLLKREEDVDALIEAIERDHPEIPTGLPGSEEVSLSKQDGETIEGTRESERSKESSESNEGGRKEIRRCRELLKEHETTYLALETAAVRKRRKDLADPRVLYLAIAVTALSLLACVLGGIGMMLRVNGAFYLLFAGLAFLMMTLASGILPQRSNTKRAIDEAYEKAVRDMEDIWPADSVVPPQLAHPLVLDRMEESIVSGRAQDARQALAIVREDLMALNRSVTVTQDEYDEIIRIKPLFLVERTQ